jgi:hypothetical protein
MILQPATPKSGEDPGGAHPARSPLKLEKIWLFCVKWWFFTRNTPKIFAPPSARRNFLKCAPLAWNPGSAPGYVLLADDHENNASYFPFMSTKKVVPYFCVLREGYYVIIWLIVRICVFIKDWKLINSELFILKRKSMEKCGVGQLT